jgi:hypothetical protein
MHWNSEEVANTVRYEKKYMIVGQDIDTVVDYLRLNGFDEEFEQRSIRNIYFDTEDYRCYEEHIAGIMDRYKVRFRWYEQNGKDFLTPAVEVKARSGDIGYKFRYDIDGFNKVSDFSHSKIQAKVKQKKIREELSHIKPNIFIAYDRRYFRHSFQTDLRLTLDFNMKAKHYTDEDFVPISEQTLVEVKYPPLAQTVDWNSAFGAGKLNQDLDLQPLRFSKYVTAVEKLAE